MTIFILLTTALHLITVIHRHSVYRTSLHLPWLPISIYTPVASIILWCLGTTPVSELLRSLLRPIRHW